MDDNEFWLKFFKYVIVGICSLILIGNVSCQSSKYQLRKMTEATGSAIEASCAMTMIDKETAQSGDALLCSQHLRGGK